MLTLTLAFRNITHAGLRTWLNVLVLSFAFVLIVTLEGIYDGMSEQIKDAMIGAEIGGGQFWQREYDPYDPFSFERAHAVLPASLAQAVAAGDATPVLLVSAAIFPRGHIQSALLKGIDPAQKIVEMPTDALNDRTDTVSIPGLIGARMASSTGLQVGDYVSVRWRTVKGTFDAGDIRIVKIMTTTVQSIDKDQLWIPLERLRTMMGASGEATVVTMKKDVRRFPAGDSNWILRDHRVLLKDINDTIAQKKISASFMFVLLLGMALLAVFDTQVLAIFRRRREMGTLMALGMTRRSVITLFTLEGCMLGILAFIAGSLYGLPLLTYLATKGIAMPQITGQYGFSLGTTLYPKYGLQLYVVTSLILFVSVVVVSFLPTRKITTLKPTDALRGKFS